MSSIFGYSTSNNIIKASGLSLWNKFYGNSEPQMVYESGVHVGSCISSFSSHPTVSDPVLSNDRYIAAIDAIIYNRNVIINDLGIDVSSSDEQCLFELFIQKGPSALKAVNGDFAGAVFDKQQNTFTLFRDHLGVRPLFYYFDGQTFVFSTDIRGITSISELNISINREWAYKTLAGYIPASESKTELVNVYRVSPASYICVHLSDQGCILDPAKAYWKPATKKIRFLSLKKYADTLRRLVDDSIRLRINSFPGKIGSELSGGLDSSVISAMINRFGREGVYFSWSKSPKIHPIKAHDDERIIIQSICEKEKIECHYNDTPYDEWHKLFDSILKSSGQLTDPFEYNDCLYALPAYANTFSLFITGNVVKSNGSSVVFSGHGGDEGISHRSNSFELYYNHEYYHYLRFHFAKTHGEKHRIKKTLQRIRTNQVESKNELLKPFNSGRTAKDFIAEDLMKESRNYNFSPLYFNFQPIKYILEGCTTLRPECAALLGSYAGVQYVFPYLDYRVIDFALSIPRHCFLYKGRTRFVFKEAYKDVIPEKLYRFTPKEDSSKKGDDSTESDWYPPFAENRSATLKLFNREMFAGILDFEKLKAWEESGRPSDDDIMKNIFALDTLDGILPAQTSLTNSRLVADSFVIT